MCPGKCCCACRYEVLSTDLEVLEELDIVLIGIDRPSYGWSDSDADRHVLWPALHCCSLCLHLHVLGAIVVACLLHAVTLARTQELETEACRS
jgi:hypothetical protein